MAVDWTNFTPWSSLAGGMLLGVAAAMLALPIALRQMIDHGLAAQSAVAIGISSGFCWQRQPSAALLHYVSTMSPGWASA